MYYTDHVINYFCKISVPYTVSLTRNLFDRKFYFTPKNIYSTNIGINIFDRNVVAKIRLTNIYSTKIYSAKRNIFVKNIFDKNILLDEIFNRRIFRAACARV